MGGGWWWCVGARGHIKHVKKAIIKAITMQVRDVLVMLAACRHLVCRARAHAHALCDAHSRTRPLSRCLSVCPLLRLAGE